MLLSYINETEILITKMVTFDTVLKLDVFNINDIDEKGEPLKQVNIYLIYDNVIEKIEFHKLFLDDFCLIFNLFGRTDDL